jgi:hypothetical protein
MVRPRRLVVLALLGALVSALVVGCGGGQSGSSAALPLLDDLAPVADATERADSARFELEFSFDVPGFATPLSFTATGAYDTPAKAAALTMDLGSFAELLGGFAGALGGEAPEGLGDPSKWKLDLRMDGGVAYMRMPLLASELPAGKEWVAIDLARAARLQGAELDDLQSLARGSDPRQALDYLRAVAGKVTHVGTEDVRGVPTSHYFAVVDWQKALASAAAQANQPGLLDQLEGFGATVGNIPVDVWVDENRLLRRMTMKLSMASGGQEAGGTLALELFDYGQPVDVEAPAAADVVDAFSLTG